jgi:hypothetical protein
MGDAIERGDDQDYRPILDLMRHLRISSRQSLSACRLRRSANGR